MANVVNLKKVTVGELADRKMEVARHVKSFYVSIGHELRKLEAYKRRHGICTCGISCLKFATGHSIKRGTKDATGAVLWCEDHKPGKREPLMKRYVTPYGLMVLAERMLQKKKAQRSTAKVKRRAA
jgi:hypothetical protein